MTFGEAIQRFGFTAAARLLRRALQRRARTVPTYRPDHNGECLNCDEREPEHLPNGECPAWALEGTDPPGDD